MREYCDSLRHEVDLAREIAIEKIHKDSNALMTEIDTYERECLSSWTAAKVTVEDVSKRVRSFLAEQQEHLQSVRTSDDELTLRLDKSRKLAKELSERKKELKATMFNDQLASFHAFPSIGDASLGELTFKSVQLPFKTLEINSNDLKPVNILTDYDFLLPIDRGQCIVTFNRFYDKDDDERCFTQINAFDWAGRLIGSSSRNLEFHVESAKVAQYGPDEFVICDGPGYSQLSVYNSHLSCLRSVDCRNFTNICSNSEFVFGLWDAKDEHSDEYESVFSGLHAEDDYTDYADDQVGCSSQRIHACHFDTLRTAFCLLVPAKYTIDRIVADEQHVVAMSRLREPHSRQSFMSIFDLATWNESAVLRGRKVLRFFLIESHIELTIERRLMSRAFLFDGWLVVPLKDELVWFDKSGKRSETSTKLDNVRNVRAFCASGSNLLFAVRNNQLFLKR